MHRAKSKKRFRIGQRVQTIYDASHAFVIDKSRIPDRIFHEKGSDRWWTKNDLRQVGAAENPLTSHRLNGTEEHARGCAQCAQGHPREPESTPSLAKRLCLACNAIFEPVKPWQRFDSEDCRRAYWKQNRSARVRSEAPQALEAIAGD